MRCRFAPPRTEAGIAATAIAVMTAPACRGVKPLTSCSFCAVISSTPASTNIPPAAAITPPEKRRERKMSKVSSGSSRRCWRRTKSQPAATATTIAMSGTHSAPSGLARPLIVMVSPDSANSE